MTAPVLFWDIIFLGAFMLQRKKWLYQIDEDTHVLLGQPVEEVSWVAG